MILAGIDEAGLGPTLGPLVTAAAALAVPDGWLPESPWLHLADAIAEKWTKGDTRPAVADSKIIYKSGGLEALALTLGTFSALANAKPEYPVTVMDQQALHPCYQPFPDESPLSGHCGDALHSATERLATALRHNQAAAVHLEAAALPEPLLNRRFADGLNKNQALLQETGRHLAILVEKFAGQPALIVVDKQGGRNDYLPFLTSLFPGIWIDAVETGANSSIYRLRQQGGDVEIRFLAKADRLCFATALASLAAKYTREWAMERFNAWFCDRLTGLRPTAGYPEDAKRWLNDVRAWSGCGELSLESVIRER